jgi:hypothetical protein
LHIATLALSVVLVGVVLVLSVISAVVLLVLQLVVQLVSVLLVLQVLAGVVSEAKFLIATPSRRFVGAPSPGISIVIVAVSSIESDQFVQIVQHTLQHLYPGVEEFPLHLILLHHPRVAVPLGKPLEGILVGRVIHQLLGRLAKAGVGLTSHARYFSANTGEYKYCL